MHRMHVLNCYIGELVFEAAAEQRCCALSTKRFAVLQHRTASFFASCECLGPPLF